jgi:hypothetical protein
VRAALVFYTEELDEQQREAMASDAKEADCIVVLGYRHLVPTGFLKELFPVVLSAAPTLVVDCAEDELEKMRTLVADARKHRVARTKAIYEQGAQKFREDFEREQAKLQKIKEFIDAEANVPLTEITCSDLTTARFASLIPRMLA